MSPNRFIQAVFFPLTESGVLFALAGFWLLVALVGFAGMFGIWLAIIVVPAVIRYQLYLLEAQAHGRRPQPPGIEFFNWVHDAWTLFPVVIVVAMGWAAYAIDAAAGPVAMFTFMLCCGILYPAMLGVLAITHSPAQSINPIALYRFVVGCGLSYAVAPVYLLLIAFIFPMTREMGVLARSFVEMFFVFSLHSVIGAVIEPRGIVDDVYIPDAREPDADEQRDNIEKNRAGVLGHAYSFISRDNREGGIGHIVEAIGKDTDPKGAWAWYFERMMGWENRQHVLFFAQHYIHDALQHGERVVALKVIMRCRMIDENFRPFPDDVPAAIAAAEGTRNAELAAVLKRS